MNRKKIISWVVLGVSAALILAAVVLLCVFLVGGKGPKKVEILEENGKVILETEDVSSEFGYTFRFRGSESISVHSDLNILEFSTEVERAGVVVGEKYFVSVCINGENQAGNSKFSDEVEWTAKKFLAAPTISLHGDIIYWAEVESADFYDVYCTVGNELVKTTVNNSSCKIENLSGGQQNVFVIAKSNKSYYLQSLPSNTLVNISVIHELLPLEAVQFDASTKILTVYSKEVLYGLEVFLGQSETVYTKSTLVDLNPTKSGELYRTAVNIDLIYNGQQKLGVKPLADSNNKFSGEIFWINA